MQSLETLKTKSQEGLNRLVEAGKQQRPEIQLWSVVAVSAVAGSILVSASAKGVLAVVGLLAATPVALTIGALGGGAVGWSIMQNRTSDVVTQPAATTPVVSDLPEAMASAAL